MKYDFSTYILDKLNEADEKKKVNVFDTDESAKTKTFALTDEDSIENWIAKNYKNITLKKDNLIYISPENNEEYTLKSKFDIKKLYNEIKEIAGDKAKALNKDGFELLGKTIAYRSALTVWNMINKDGDDFKQAALDVFKDNSEYSIKQLETLDSLLDYSAAVGVVKDKKNRLDKNEANYETLLKKCNDAETQLATKEKYTIIQQIKKDYEKEFNDKRDVYEKAFNDGMAEQKKEMQGKDYKWKDPATGKEPKGAEKLNQLGDKAYKMLESGVEKADEFAKKQQGLDKALLTLAVIGVKGMLFGGKVLKNLINEFFKHTNIKGAMRHSAKFNDVVQKIDTFKKEYDEYKKNGNDEQKKTILMKFAELMNTHLIPYYYCKLSFIVACVENIEGKYIIKQENNLWNTLNSSTGRVTIIEDNAILIKRLLKEVENKLSEPLKEFGNEPCTDSFKSIPTDFTFKKNYLENFLKWVDRIKEVKMKKLEIQRNGFKKDKLKNLDKIYNEKVIKNDFNSYQEFLTYIQTVRNFVEQCDLPVAYNLKFTFDGDEDAGVPGVITGAKKEETKEEQKEEKSKEEIKQEISEIEQKINKDLNSLKDINGLEKLTSQFIELSKEVNNNYTAIVDLNNKNLDDEKRAKLNEPFHGANKDIFNKMLYINLSKKMNEVQSPVYNKVMFYFLLESEENVVQDSYDKLISVLTKDISLENIDKIKEQYNAFAKDMIEWYKSLNDEQKAAIEKFKDDPLALYLARKTLKKTKEKSGENNQETQSS